MLLNNPQRRHWCWTLWLTDDASEEEAEVIARQMTSSCSAIVRYSVCQLERSEDLTKCHLQGYTEFRKSLRMSEVKRHFQQKTIHLEPRLGSRADARSYCISKTWKGESKRRAGGPWETGGWISDIVGSAPQRKSHAATAIECLLRGMLPHQIAAAHPTAFFTHSRKVLDTWQALKDAEVSGIFDYKSSDEEE